MKRLSVILSVLVALSMLLAACGSAPAAETETPAAPDAAATDAPAADAPAAELEGTLKVWSFTNDTLVLATAFQEVHPKVNIEFTMIPMNGGEFQTKIDREPREHRVSIRLTGKKLSDVLPVGALVGLGAIGWLTATQEAAAPAPTTNRPIKPAKPTPARSAPTKPATAKPATAKPATAKPAPTARP